jgi:hypothetical protein
MLNPGPNASMASAKALLSAVESRGVTPPTPLTNLVAAHQLLADSAEAPTDPAKAILDAAEAGTLTLESARELATAGVIDRQVGEYLSTVAAQSHHKFLLRFHESLNAGYADEILDALRAEFAEAAATVTQTLQLVDASVPDSVLVNRATSEQLDAWRALPAQIAVLSGIAGIATRFGMASDFPLIQNPRDVDVQLHNVAAPVDVAVMCTGGDLIADSLVFRQPAPAGDVRQSPWVRVQPRLWTIAEARERIREYAERVWTVMDSGRPKAGQIVDGEVVYFERRNPFTKKKAVSS